MSTLSLKKMVQVPTEIEPKAAAAAAASAHLVLAYLIAPSLGTKFVAYPYGGNAASTPLMPEPSAYEDKEFPRSKPSACLFSEIWLLFWTVAVVIKLLLLKRSQNLP